MFLSQRSGQTLLEMVIAIGIIIVSTLATTGLIVTTITAGRVSQNRVEAANFAREGIEVVRIIRDSNYLRRDQNILECNFNNGGTDSPIEWDDSGSQFDGYCPLGGSCGPDFCFDTSTPATKFYVADFTPAPQLRTCRIGVFLCTGAAGDYFQTQTTIKERTMTIGGVAGSKIFLQTAANPCPAPCSPTKYSRIISIITASEAIAGIGTVEYLDVASTVKWNERTGLKTLVARERLYNWR